MADPISILGLVLAIAGAASTLLELLKNIREGPEEIKTISKDAHCIAAIVSELQAILENARNREIIDGEDAMLQMIDYLKIPLSNCQEVLDKLVKRVSKLQKKSRPGSEGRADRTRFPNIKWGLSIKSEVRQIQLQLEAAKSTLNTALSGITLYAIISLSSLQCMDDTNGAQDIVGCACWP